MTQQLRLVDPPPGPKEISRKAQAGAKAAGRPADGSNRRPSRTGAARTARTTSPRARRAASWGEWQLDSRTRRVGKAGVAAARRALEEAAAGAHAVQSHRRAS